MLMSAPIECPNCKHSFLLDHSGPCPNCGLTIELVNVQDSAKGEDRISELEERRSFHEAFGTGNGKTSLAIRVKNPKPVNGKETLVTTVKTTISDNVQATTIKRTIDGQHYALQLKFIIQPNGEVEYDHIHCQKDKQSSKWYKVSGLPIEKFYDISQDNGANIIRCKACGKRWSSVGRMKTHQTKSNSHPNQTSR